MNKAAILSADGRYRYQLTREWDADLPTVGFIMLNPSTADASIDDPTIRKCVKFAQRWGYGRLIVGNLYAYRATDPKDLFAAYLPTPEGDIIGPCNDDWIRRTVRASDRIVCAWGTKSPLDRRAPFVRNTLLHGHPEVRALRITVDGHPGHPLYLRDDAQCVPY